MTSFLGEAKYLRDKQQRWNFLSCNDCSIGEKLKVQLAPQWYDWKKDLFKVLELVIILGFEVLQYWRGVFNLTVLV